MKHHQTLRMEKIGNRKGEIQTPATRELFLSADTSEKIPEQMMNIEEDSGEENGKDENNE